MIIAKNVIEGDKMQTKHDGFFKRVVESKADLREFLEHYLPSDLKKEVDLSTAKLEKETYIEERLTKLLSDVVIFIRKKDKGKIYAYGLIEHQSSDDKWIAYRLEKYKLALLERHKTPDGKFPLVHGIVIYNGREPYKAPGSFWELFEEPEKAKAMHGKYTLVDLRSMPDEDIINKGHWGMVEYAMKHIHKEDPANLLDNFFRHFKDVIPQDKQSDYIYIKSLLWYIDSRVSIEDKARLSKITNTYLNKEEGEEIMRTIAQAYIDEGIKKGIEKGIEKEKFTLAKSMLKKSMDIQLIAELTGLSKQKIRKLQ